MEGVDIEPGGSPVLLSLLSKSLEAGPIAGSQETGAEQRRGLHGITIIENQKLFALGDRLGELPAVEAAGGISRAGSHLRPAENIAPELPGVGLDARPGISPRDFTRGEPSSDRFDATAWRRISRGKIGIDQGWVRPDGLERQRGMGFARSVVQSVKKSVSLFAAVARPLFQPDGHLAFPPPDRTPLAAPRFDVFFSLPIMTLRPSCCLLNAPVTQPGGD